MGNQTSKWLLSKHAKAYTSLAMPEAKRIARLSGIPQEPQDAAMCLGCHATGSEAEDWEKDETFSFKDGVQCEKCHGAGSEYMDAKVMTNREAAIRKGLNIMAKGDCLKCHKEKDSHKKVLKQPPLDMEKAWAEIAHPTPQDWDPTNLQPPKPPVAEKTAAKYTGSIACGECHTKPAFGFQFSTWRDSKHADAYAVLGTPRGKSVAAQMGVRGDPQVSLACLKCHATAYHDPAAGAEDSYSVYEGVGCEACHGAGSQYSPEKVMKDKPQAFAAGLKKIGPQTCTACHENAHGKPFDYQTAVKTIAHPTKPPVVVDEPRYKTPLNLALRPDGEEIYVACEALHSVVVIDVRSRRKVAEVAVGGLPQGVTFAPDSRRAYVSNRLDDTVSAIDVASRKVFATIRVDSEPHGLLTDRSGKMLYVLNTSAESISVIDTQSLKEVKRLSASRGPWSLALSPDGSRMVVTNSLSRFVRFRTPPLSEVTVLDLDRVVVAEARWFRERTCCRV